MQNSKREFDWSGLETGVQLSPCGEHAISLRPELSDYSPTWHRESAAIAGLIRLLSAAPLRNITLHPQRDGAGLRLYGACQLHRPQSAPPRSARHSRRGWARATSAAVGPLPTPPAWPSNSDTIYVRLSNRNPSLTEQKTG
ncbi:hypothetical protein AAFF_G00232450 [Aldrovandia affinis]|uniref:Uncharacterized protein n=1 Tax=Aldrovandia affinis TaxID=143900 RepID=A0AAD7W4A2_9TELE|nr:hypothetical protein AAFF_G00232450 [Aldrovandia affinis]